MLWGYHYCDSYLSLPRNEEFGGDSCPWSTISALSQERLRWKKAMSEKHQKLKWHWGAPPCMVFACGSQGLQASRLSSLNQKTFALFLVGKIGWTYPIPHSPFGKGKNFPTELFESLYHYWQMAIWEFYTWQPEGWWGTSGHLCISVVLR